MGFSAAGPDSFQVSYGFLEAFDLPPSTGRLWDSDLSYAVSYTAPAIGPDGTLYVGTRVTTYYPPNEGTVRAINPDGTPKWTYTRSAYPYTYTSRAFESSLAVGRDGTVYIGCDDGLLYALWPSGQLRWRTQLVPNGAPVRSSPSIGPDGTVYIGADASGGGFGFHAVNGTTGQILWSKLANERVTCTPIQDASGNVYVGSSASKVYSWTSTGGTRGGTSWPVTTVGEVDSYLAIGTAWTAQLVEEHRRIASGGTAPA